MIKKAKNFRIFLLITLFVFLIGSINSYTAQAFGKSTNKNFLWKVTSKTNSVYLLGSLHVASEELYPLDQKIEKAFEESNYLVVESDIADLETSKTIQEIAMKRGIYSQCESLKVNIPEKLYIKLKEEIKQYGMNVQQINVINPWLLAFMIAHLRVMNLGYNPKFGIDLYFLNKARDKKEIFEIESPEFLINILSDFSPELQILLLEDVVNASMIEEKEEIEKIFIYWKRGDVGNVENFIFRAFNENPKLKPIFERIFVERNKKMVGKIEGYLKNKEPYFIIVGAGHLVGKNGIINILEDEGYKIEQL